VKTCGACCLATQPEEPVTGRPPSDALDGLVLTRPPTWGLAGADVGVPGRSCLGFRGRFWFWPAREQENLVNLVGVLLMLAIGVFATLVV